MKNIITLIISFLVFSLGYGQIITFDFNGNIGNEVSVGSNFNDVNLSSAAITRGSGLTATVNGNRFNAINWAANDIATAVIGNEYMEFTVAPNSGFQFDVTTISVNFQRSGTGPRGISLRSSIDGYAADIDGEKVIFDNTNITQIVSFSVNQVNNVTALTYRIYGWAEGTSGTGGFEGAGNDIIINGTVAGICTSPTVNWDGTNWFPTAPNINTRVTINANYNTGNGGNEVSFSACNLNVNAPFRLTVDNSTYVEVENNVVVNGELYVETQGAFVQNDDAGTFTNNGTSLINKTTALKQAWYYYTYWSSPVENETALGAFPDTDTDRRFWFNASNYLDENTVGTTNGIPDDIDDNGDDWQIVAGGTTLIPGVGYAATAGPFHIPGASDSATFNGAFNTGDIDTSISFDVLNTLGSWNFIGNPYPSAIDFIAFQAANSGVIGGTAYFWSQAASPDATNPGNEVSNFSQNDYATYAAGTGMGAAGGGPLIPTQYIPSAQGFFIVGLDNLNATFTNAMRVTGNNDQFFRATNSALDNKLWINLTSDNGVFSQIAVGYVNGATRNNDGLMYDAPRNLSAGAASVLYTTIDDSNKKFVIQGKAINDLTEDEVIRVGFKTTIDVATLYKFSIAQFEGDFFSNNTVYLKDSLLNVLHDLCLNDYAFTSEVGEFNDRFEIVFNPEALSLGENTVNRDSLSIIELNNGNVQFKLSSYLELKSIEIIDLLGRTLYRLEANGNSKTYNLSNLNQATYIAKVELSNGVVITKKAVKRN
ncbi:T9SS type A sorting domain-containing protein [Olleya sp. AH-315-F22]|nr:T9SS type A sorting domain-containing protein [Olleya sp. AH-315-F22]